MQSVGQEIRANIAASEHAPFHARVRSAVSDITTLVLALPIFAYGLYRNNFDPDESAVKKDKTPILLVHGNGCNQIQWWKAHSFLSIADLGSVFSLDLDGYLTNEAKNRIEDYAELVAQKILQICKTTGSNRIRLIGHSMGGLVAAYFTEYLARKYGIEVEMVITISTPWQTSKTHQLAAEWLPSVFKEPARLKEMLNENGWLDALKAKVLRVTQKTLYFAIYSTGDNLVPGNSGKLDLDPSRVKEYDDKGHYSAMRDQELWDQVVAWLLQYGAAAGRRSEIKKG